MNSEEIGQAIIKTAEHFLGLHEIKQNAQWDDLSTEGQDKAAQELKDALLATGWQEGWAYCAAFCEAVWRKTYEENGAPLLLQKQIAQRFNASVLASFNNWNVQKMIETIAQPGAVFFMQHGSSSLGHAGIVVRVDGRQMATIEGNTSPQAGTPESDREGDGIFRRVRKIEFIPKSAAAGLWLRGFLNPVTWD